MTPFSCGSINHGIDKDVYVETTTTTTNPIRAQLDILLNCGEYHDECHGKDKISSLLNWSVIHGLLQHLKEERSCAALTHDPFGRLLLGRLVARNPPSVVLQEALQVFPDSLSHNPAAFFAACQGYSSPEVICQMMKHACRGRSQDSDECPYPWILSGLVTVEGAKAMVEAYPKGVLQASTHLNGYSPLDYFLFSEEMIEQRKMDIETWQKFKLFLVAAECAGREDSGCNQQACSVSPLQVFLDRVLFRRDCLDNVKLAQHVLWLLHQLCWSDPWIFSKQGRDSKYPIHHVLSRKCTVNPTGLVAARELVKILIVAHSAAARHTIHGRTALHMAIENGWPCHDLLLSVHPEALNTPDPRTELYPYQGSAVVADGQETDSSMSLDVTFELLRANPCHIRVFSEESVHVGA